MSIDPNRRLNPQDRYDLQQGEKILKQFNSSYSCFGLFGVKQETVIQTISNLAEKNLLVRADKTLLQNTALRLDNNVTISNAIQDIQNKSSLKAARSLQEHEKVLSRFVEVSKQPWIYRVWIEGHWKGEAVKSIQALQNEHRLQEVDHDTLLVLNKLFQRDEVSSDTHRALGAQQEVIGRRINTLANMINNPDSFTESKKPIQDKLTVLALNPRALLDHDIRDYLSREELDQITPNALFNFFILPQLKYTKLSNVEIVEILKKFDQPHRKIVWTTLNSHSVTDTGIEERYEQIKNRFPLSL